MYVFFSFINQKRLISLTTVYSLALQGLSLVSNQDVKIELKGREKRAKSILFGIINNEN